MSPLSPPSPNPKRVAAGRRNGARRGPLTPEGRERLRRAALAGRPWEASTGPRTAAGKARAAGNGKLRQRGDLSVRALRASLLDARDLATDLVRCRALVAELMAGQP